MNQRTMGVLLVVAGVLALLHTLGWTDARAVAVVWWPLFLVLVGLVQMRGGSPLGGLIVIVIGAAFLLRNLGLIPSAMLGMAWPLLLVAAGLYLLVGRRPGTGTARHESPSVRLFTAFSASNHRLESREFQGAELTVLFGSLEVDARLAEPDEDGAVVDVGVVAGGITLRVPEGWRVVPVAVVLFGGIEDKRPRVSSSQEDAPRLYIRGFVLMGNVEVQS